MQGRVSKCNIRLIFILIIFSCSSILAQTSEKISLATLLDSLETTHDIRFSFAPEHITGLEILKPSKNASLEETLVYLQENTPLLFTKVNERYITIVLKSDENFRCGRLVDATSKEPLEGGTIISTTGDFSTLTNKEGIFYIPENVESDSFSIQHLGYLNYLLHSEALGKDCPTIMMQVSVEKLSAVSLQTYFTKGISKTTDGSFIINTENFGLLPGQVEGDVLQIAQALPGVESVDETISNINIRGGTHDENTILWDDIKMYQSGHFFGLISAFNPDLTKKVFVYKNGTNPRFGEGVSGVIDMHSKDAISTSLSGGLGFNLINGHAYAEIPLSKSVGIQVSGRRSFNDFVKSPVYNIYTNRIFQDTEISTHDSNLSGVAVSSENDFKFYDFSTKFLWDYSEAGNIRVNFLTTDNDLEFTETIENSLDSETGNLDQKSVVGGLSWSHDWNNKLNTTLLGYASFYSLMSVNEEIFTTQKMTQENEVLETGIKLDASYRFTEKAAVQAGYHFSETGITNIQDVNLPRFRTFEKDVLRSHIVFGNFQFNTTENDTRINLGLRANYFDKFSRFLVEPRLSAYQSLGNGFSIEALGEFKSQTTTQRIDFESDFLGVEKRRWVLTDNQDVPIIRSKQASIGFVYNKFNWFVNIEGFYKYVQGITSSNQGFQNQFQFVRTHGDYSSSGIEFVLNKKTKAFSTWLSYMCMNTEYQFDTLEPSNFPSNLDIRHTVSLASSFSRKNIKFALGINWRSGKPYTVPNEDVDIIFENGIETIKYNAPNEERLPSYFRTNLSAEYLWTLSNKIDAKFNFAILNVFNTQNTLNIRYALDKDVNNEVRINQIEEQSLGITPNFSLQVLF